MVSFGVKKTGGTSEVDSDAVGQKFSGDAGDDALLYASDRLQDVARLGGLAIVHPLQQLKGRLLRRDLPCSRQKHQGAKHGKSVTFHFLANQSHFK